MQRRNFLGGLAGIFAAGAAPAIIHNAMKIVVPKQDLILPNVGRGLTTPIIHVDEAPIQIGLGNVENFPTITTIDSYSEFESAYPSSGQKPPPGMEEIPKDYARFVRAWVHELQKGAARQNDQRVLAFPRRPGPPTRKAFA